VYIAVRHLGDTLVWMINNIICVPVYTIIACTIVMMVCTKWDWVDADLVVVLNLTYIANLFAFPASCSLHFAVLNWRAAQVVCDFHICILAV